MFHLQRAQRNLLLMSTPRERPKNNLLTISMITLLPSDYSCFVSSYAAKIEQVHLFGSSPGLNSTHTLGCILRYRPTE